MMKKVKTYPSVPLIKLGGMSNEGERIPLYGSIRMCITGEDESIYTTTQSKILKDAKENTVIINGKQVTGKPKKRVENIFSKLLDYCKIDDRINFYLESENIGYPTEGGLSSSAAGSAAAVLSLYLALREQYPEINLSKKELSEIARQGSSSAIGSVIGGFSEVKVSKNNAWGEKIGDSELLPDLEIYVAFVKGGTKSDDIHKAMENSRYIEKRIEFVNKTIPKMKEALLKGDTKEVIYYTHEDTKNFHGALLDQGILTFEPDTLRIFKKIEEMHKNDKPIGCSIAGGPNVIVLSTEKYAEKAIEELFSILPEERIKKCKVMNNPEW